MKIEKGEIIKSMVEIMAEDQNTKEVLSELPMIAPLLMVIAYKIEANLFNIQKE